MLTFEPTGTVLGATVRNADLAAPLDAFTVGVIVRALGEFGVLCFPAQRIDADDLRRFASRFGSLQVGVSGLHEPGVPEVSILSNMVENGKPVGLADAGQDWHTDMSYNKTIGFANVLHALRVPRRNGKALGATMFASMHAAYEALDTALHERLRDATVTHDFNKFWDNMCKRPGSTRAPLTVAQRATRPPSVHPLFLTHPVTGRKVLYCNPGYAIKINELNNFESDRTLAELLAHQLQPQFQHRHDWTEGDVLMWDHIGTLHCALPDYESHEHRLIKRCQVMADRIFDPAFLRACGVMHDGTIERTGMPA